MIYNILIAVCLFLVGVFVGLIIFSASMQKERIFGTIRIFYDSEDTPYAGIEFYNRNAEQDLKNKKYAVFKIVK